MYLKIYVLTVQTQDMKGNCDKIYEIYKSINAYYIVVVLFLYVCIQYISLRLEKYSKNKKISW